MIPKNCEFSEESKGSYRCPLVGSEGFFIIDICPESCPLVKLELRCQENWAFADTATGMVKDVRDELQKKIKYAHARMDEIFKAVEKNEKEISALTERVRQHYEQHDAEKALLWKEISVLTEKVEEYARMVLKVRAKREANEMEIRAITVRVEILRKETKHLYKLYEEFTELTEGGG